MNKSYKTRLENMFGHKGLSSIHDFQYFSGSWLRAQFKMYSWSEEHQAQMTHYISVRENETYQQAIERCAERLKEEEIARMFKQA